MVERFDDVPEVSVAVVERRRAEIRRQEYRKRRERAISGRTLIGYYGFPSYLNLYIIRVFLIGRVLKTILLYFDLFLSPHPPPP